MSAPQVTKADWTRSAIENLMAEGRLFSTIDDLVSSASVSKLTVSARKGGLSI